MSVNLGGIFECWRTGTICSSFVYEHIALCWNNMSTENSTIHPLFKDSYNIELALDVKTFSHSRLDAMEIHGL